MVRKDGPRPTDPDQPEDPANDNDAGVTHPSRQPRITHTFDKDRRTHENKRQPRAEDYPQGRRRGGPAGRGIDGVRAAEGAALRTGRREGRRAEIFRGAAGGGGIAPPAAAIDSGDSRSGRIRPTPTRRTGTP